MNKTSKYLHLVILALVSNATTAFASTDTAILKQALSRSNAGPSYTYDVLYNNDGFEAFIHVDPTLPRNQRVSVSSPPRNSWDAEFTVMLEEMDKEAGVQFWCTDFAENIPLDASIVSETSDVITYRFKPLSVDEDDEFVMPHLIGTVTVSRYDPAILSISMKAEVPFSPMPFGTFDEFEMSAQCAQLPDGRSHVTQVSQIIRGKIASEEIRESAVWRLLQHMEIPGS